jgi:hypothetical protein
MTNFNEPYLTNKEQEYIDDVFKRKQFHGNSYYTKNDKNSLVKRSR